MKGKIQQTNDMKTKMILLAALIGAASMSAQAGVRFGFSIRLPLPFVFAPPVAVAAPVVVAAPVAVVQTVPVCPGPNYVWAPGYWPHRTTGYCWVPGVWRCRPAYVVHGGFYAGRRW